VDDATITAAVKAKLAVNDLRVTAATETSPSASPGR
jgi:hypothetical protein